MAVAVRNAESTSAGVLNRLPVAILVGVVYLLASIGVLVAIWWLWWAPEFLGRLWTDAQGQLNPPMVSYVLLYLVEMAAGVGLAYGATRLFGPHPPRGLKAGVFLAFAMLLVVALVTRAFGMWFENLAYESGSISPFVGQILTVLVAGTLLAVFIRWLFLQPASEPRLIAIEDQGWFSTTSYKRNQGQRVRRGTIIALLSIAAYGIWTMEAHKTLHGYKNWSLDLPFTGTMVITSPGDADDAGLLTEDQTSVGRQQLKDINSQLSDPKEGWVRIENPGTSGWQVGELMKRSKFTAREEELRKDPGEVAPTAKPAEPAKGTLRHAGVVVLPDVRFTLPLILAALGLWVSWRTVNMPAFADFLIATEAELNKVSWTTRKRLFQDTLVVLTTLVLMTVFLFVVDVLWGKILSSRLIQVLRLPDQTKSQQVENQPW